MKEMGMNTGRVWQSTGSTKAVIKEALETGLTRIEISYCFRTTAAFKVFKEPGFISAAEGHIELVQKALNSTKGCRHRLPQLRLLEHFQDLAKKHQVYIEMRFLAAMVYCKNDKRSSYTGTFKNIRANTDFDTETYIKAVTLAGPDSKVHCHIQRDGPFGYTVKKDFIKMAPIC